MSIDSMLHKAILKVCFKVLTGKILILILVYETHISINKIVPDNEMYIIFLKFNKSVKLILGLTHQNLMKQIYLSHKTSM